MKKSRTVIRDIKEEVYAGLATSQGIFPALQTLGVSIPEWASVMFVFTRFSRRSLDVSFFDEPHDFFMWYSRVLISRKEDMRVASFSKENSEWKTFLPPTLIGIDLQTRLR